VLPRGETVARLAYPPIPLAAGTRLGGPATPRSAMVTSRPASFALDSPPPGARSNNAPIGERRGLHRARMGASPRRASLTVRHMSRSSQRRSEHTCAVQIRIEGHDLPGRSCRPGPGATLSYQNIHVGVQRRNRPADLLGLVPGDAPSAGWTLDCTAHSSPDGIDLKGPYIQGPPAGRFIYLSWGTVDGDTFTMFRRAKLWFDAVPRHVMRDAVDSGVLVGRLGLTDQKGDPLCAAVRPPTIEWLAAAH
jgi:hypothetical protein